MQQHNEIAKKRGFKRDIRLLLVYVQEMMDRLRNGKNGDPDFPQGISNRHNF